MEQKLFFSDVLKVYSPANTAFIAKSLTAFCSSMKRFATGKIPLILNLVAIGNNQKIVSGFELELILWGFNPTNDVIKHSWTRTNHEPKILLVVALVNLK